MVTADTITDEQIRELRDAHQYRPPGSSGYGTYLDCRVALGQPSSVFDATARPSMWRHPDPSDVAKARALCAEILNARAKESR